MSVATKLQKNLKILMKENNYNAADVEKLAGLKKNQCYSIIRGASLNPAPETVEAIASVFGLTAEDLYKEEIQEGFLSLNDIEYLGKVTNIVFGEIRTQKFSLMLYEVFRIISDSYKYSKDTNSKDPDEKYIKWLLKDKPQNL